AADADGSVLSQSPPPAELLLGRPEFNGNNQTAARLVRDRRVLVTGAAGSIGWPLTQTLLAAAPARLILLDHHEHSLFSLERSLGHQPTPAYEPADVRDEPRLRRTFHRQQPRTAIHLTAANHQ